MTGVFEVSIKVRLETDVTPEEATEIVSNMDYHLDHPMIVDTEVMGHDAEERCMDKIRLQETS